MRNWIIVVALLAAPAPTFTQKVHVDSDPSAAFARYPDTLSDKPEKNTAEMNKAIAKMFEQYPPTPK